MWEEALRETSIAHDPSPIGPDQEEARKFLLATIESRLSRVEERADNVESAIGIINDWMIRDLTHYGHREHQKVEATLYGTETASKNSPNPAS